MAYQSINARKDEFRAYLEKNGVVDAITKVLVSLYEEPERPKNPLDYIKQYLGGPGELDALKQENEKLKEKIKELEGKVEELTKEEEEEEEGAVTNQPQEVPKQASEGDNAPPK